MRHVLHMIKLAGLVPGAAEGELGLSLRGRELPKSPLQGVSVTVAGLCLSSHTVISISESWVLQLVGQPISQNITEHSSDTAPVPRSLSVWLHHSASQTNTGFLFERED